MTTEEFFKKYDDEKLIKLLEAVELDHLRTRAKLGLDTVGEWADILSGGEKQRISMCRLYFFKPVFGLLDDCTSAVSMDMEVKLYQYAKSLNITLITVSQKKNLLPYHDYLMTLDSHGNCSIEKLQHDN
jgi:ABC-type uncharacterized transport system fused permease/ATPase subunit